MHRKCFGTGGLENDTPYKVPNYTSVFKKESEQPKAAEIPPPPAVRKEIPHRMSDGNVIRVALGTLGNAVDEIMTGDPTYCQGTSVV